MYYVVIKMLPLHAGQSEIVFLLPSISQQHNNYKAHKGCVIIHERGVYLYFDNYTSREYEYFLKF